MLESPYGLIWRMAPARSARSVLPVSIPSSGMLNDVRVVDGELQLRNPAIMRGYFEMPEKTAAVVVDGWLHTGDLGEANADGTYTLGARRK